MAENEDQHTEISDTDSNGDSGALVWPFLGIILVQILGLVISDYLAWGFSYWRIIGFPLSIILLLVAALLITPPGVRLISRPLDALFSSLARLRSKPPRWLVVTFASGALLALFYIFRSRALVYGDGFALLAQASDKVLTIPKGQLLVQIPTVLVYHFSVLWGKQFLGLSAETSFAVLNCAAGVVGVWALYKIASLVTTNVCGRCFILLGALASGATILFFGYIENYTLVTVLGLWSLYWCVRYILNKSSVLPAILFSLLATIFHLIGMLFLLTALSAVILKLAERKDIVYGVTLTRLFVFLILISAAVALIIQLGGFWPIAVPVLPLAGVSYWVLSLHHLLDLFNQLFLVAPLGVAAFVYLLVTGRLRRREMDSGEAILAVASIVTFVAVFWMNADLGAARDWDLLSLVGFPLSLWGGYALLRTATAVQSCTRLLMPVTLIVVVCLTPNVVEKNDVTVATNRLVDMLWHDAHYQQDYQQAARGLPWALTLDHNLGDYDAAERFLRRRVEAEPADFSAWRALGEIWFFDRNVPDSGLYYLNQAALHAPNQADLWRKLAEVELKMGKKTNALKHAQLAVQLAPADINMQSQLGAALASLGRYRDAIGPLYQAYLLAPDSCEQLVNLGDLYSYLGVHDSAYYYLSRGLTLDCRPELALDGWTSMFTSALALGKITEATQALTRLSHMKVPSAKLRKMQLRLQQAAAAGRGGN